jgi:hypothetical protein
MSQRLSGTPGRTEIVGRGVRPCGRARRPNRGAARVQAGTRVPMPSERVVSRESSMGKPDRSTAPGTTYG